MIADTLPNGYRPLQVIGALDILNSRRRIIADQPGAGKTVQVEFALELDGQLEDPTARILITAPKTACQLMWTRELHHRLVEAGHDVVVADLTGACGGKPGTNPTMPARDKFLGQKMLEAHDAGKPLIVLTNFEGIRWSIGSKPKLTNLWQIRWSALIVDESHLVLPSRVDDPKKYTQFWYGLSRLVTTPDPLRVAMSGTPDNGKLENRFGTYRFLYPERFRSYWSWVKHFFYTKPGNWGGMEIFGLRREEEWNDFQHAVMTRRTKAEMLEGLPPKQWVNVPLELHPEQRERYDEFETEIAEKIAELESQGDDHSMREAQNLRFTSAIRLRQLAICDWYQVDGKWHPKGDRTTSVGLDWICEYLEERGHHLGDTYNRDGGKVVLTGYFVEVLEWMSKQLEAEGFGKVPVLSGQTPLAEKQRIEEAFQRGELRLILFSGHIGVSISLDAADDMVFVDFPYDPDKVEQTEDRIHRASSTGVKQFWRLFAEDTIAEEILKGVDVRYNTTRKSYDGSRGATFRRRIAKLGEGEAA